MDLNNKKNDKILVYILVFFLGIGVAIGIVYYFKGELFGGSSNSNGVCYTACENKVTVNENGIADAVDKVYDAVVVVQNYVNDQLYSTGTGFVYKVNKSNGYLITNYHVINGNTKVTVIMSDGEEIDATVTGGDQYLDIAVLKIDSKYVKKVVEFANSSDSRVGDTVFTIGTPVGSEYINSVTRGILSGKDRLVSVAVSNSSTEDYVMKVLQIDASINPGNSGGPLLNSNGEVIGVNSMKLVESTIEGMGFAIAIEDVEGHLENFENGKDIERPYLGISMVNSTETYNLYRNGISINNNVTGVVVVSVVSGSSVDGYLQKGDVITKIDNEEIETLAYLRYELYKHSVGDTINITYNRDGKEYTSTVKLKANPGE